jgi:glycosidase
LLTPKSIKCAIAACSVLATTAFANVDAQRRGSQLDLAWSSNAEGTWELFDDSGALCASGRIRVGDNAVAFNKLASPTGLRLKLNHNGQRPRFHDIPGQRRLSQLPKPDRASRIYQVPVRTYAARGMGRQLAGQFNALTAERLDEIKDLGVDYLWLTGVLEHASRDQTDPDVVKGEAGSYYAIYDNWDVSAQSGSMADFEALIDRAHDAGLRVIIDFVANHTARMHRTDVLCKQHLDFGRQDRTDAFFHRDNNYYYITDDSFTPPTQNDVDGADGVFDTDIFAAGVQLENPARVTGNDIVSANPASQDWFETVKLNYGYDIQSRQAHYNPRPRTWMQMLDVAQYWVEKGVDGFRVDFAHAVPIEFWRYFASELRRVQPSVFLLAEAYESDQRMRLPGFSYHAMLEAGFDSVYNSEMYWAMHNQVVRPGTMRNANPMRSPAMNDNILRRGFMFTQYMENHDEMRAASRHFAPWVGDREQRSRLGLAYTTYLGLTPGHLMLHGGQELQEDASVFGGYAGDNGRSSIFDFVYQSQTRTWLHGTRPQWMIDFRNKYKRLLELKEEPAFAKPHSYEHPSFIDLDGANWFKEESKWIASYVRFDGDDAYLVVANGDPFVAHMATVHFTSQENHDQLGVLTALGIRNDASRYRFREVFARPGFVPRDPAVSGEGVPGWTLYKPGNVPSGLHLGEVPPATTYVFKLERL